MKLTTQLPAAAVSARDARALLRDRFAEHLPTEAMSDLLTIVSELVTNAIRHGENASIGLAVSVSEDQIHGEVQNRGRGRVEPMPLDPSGSGGLGLHIVDAITDGWAVKANGLTRVSFDLRY